MKMENFVEGYWRKNFGDDLFLKILAERYPQIIFNILIDKEFYSVFDEFNNIIPIFNNKSFCIRLVEKISREVLKLGLVLPGTIENKILKCMNYIELGGSIFIMKTKKMDNSYVMRRVISRSKVNHYVIGSNFGPYMSDNQIRRYQKVMEKCLWVSFRDEYSLSLFRNENHNLHWFPDIVFCLDTKNYEKKNEYILISVINLKERECGYQYENWLLKVIKDYIDNKKEKIVLMCFCEFQGDLEVANRLCGKLDENERDSIRVVVHREIDESLKAICKAKKVIATRYHAMILAWILEKPVYVISYSQKTTEVIKNIAPEQKYVCVEELDDNVQVEYSEYDSNYFDQTIEQAMKHFDELDKIYYKEFND